ncbi:MAG: hypothetical protein WBA35_07315 [Litorimonas sp.]
MSGPDPIKLISENKGAQPRSKGPLDFVLAEYDALWRYYIRTLDERHKVIEYYFRSVTIPASLIGVLTLFFENEVPLSLGGEEISLSRSMAAMFGVIFLVGVSLYIYYVRETSNSKRYSAALSDIRDVMAEESDFMRRALTLNQHSIRTETIRSEMPLFRAGPMIFINSAIGAVAGLLFLAWGDALSIAAFVTLVAAHLLFWASAPKRTIRITPETSI